MEKPKRIKENLFLIEPFRILASLRKNMLYILIVTIAFGALGAYIAIKKESKSWSATSKIIRYSKQISKGDDVPYQYQNFNYETALETIRTRSNLIELIRKLDLNTTTTPEELFSRFEIKRGRNSDIVEIIFTSPEQEMAAKGANALSEIFIENFYTIQNAAIERIYEYYTKNKVQKSIELYETKEAITEFLKKNNLTSLENEIAINYTLLNKLELRKLQNETDLTSYKTSIEAITESLKGLPEEVKLRYAIRSANKKALELKKKELQRQKEVYTEDHPKIQMLQSEIREIAKTIKAAKAVEPDEVTYGTNPIKSELRIVLGKTKIQYTTAQNIKKSLLSQIENVKANLGRLSALNKEFMRLKIKKEEAEAQLSMVSKRLYDLQMSIGSSKEDFKLFETAKIPKFPKPSYKKLIVILFIFLGGFLATVFVIVKEVFDNRVKTKFDLEKRFGIEGTIQLPKEKAVSTKTRQVFSYLANKIIAKEMEGVHIITLGADIPPRSKSHVAMLLLEQLTHQKHKILYIESSIMPDKDKQAQQIDLAKPLKGQQYTPVKNDENIDTLYWYIQDNYSIYIPNKEHLLEVFKNLNTFEYDYIVIDGPAYTESKHLVPMLVEHTDTFLLYAEFKTSTREMILKFMLRLEEKNLDKIKGVISETHKYFIS